MLCWPFKTLGDDSMRKFVLALWSGSAVLCFAAANESVLLWYRQAAEKLVEPMPIGNGPFGAMVFGKISEERIRLVRIPIGRAGAATAPMPLLLGPVPEIRRLLFGGVPIQSEKDSTVSFGAKPG